jgi:hypothetical protein
VHRATLWCAIDSSGWLRKDGSRIRGLQFVQFQLIALNSPFDRVLRVFVRNSIRQLVLVLKQLNYARVKPAPSSGVCTYGLRHFIGTRNAQCT